MLASSRYMLEAGHTGQDAHPAAHEQPAGGVCGVAKARQHAALKQDGPLRAPAGGVLPPTPGVRQGVGHGLHLAALQAVHLQLAPVRHCRSMQAWERRSYLLLCAYRADPAACTAAGRASMAGAQVSNPWRGAHQLEVLVENVGRRMHLSHAGHGPALSCLAFGVALSEAH